MGLFLQLCANITIMFLNSFMAMKYWIFGFPYMKFSIIIVVGYFVYKMCLCEIEDIKAPHTKANRRRI